MLTQLLRTLDRLFFATAFSKVLGNMNLIYENFHSVHKLLINQTIELMPTTVCVMH